MYTCQPPLVIFSIQRSSRAYSDGSPLQPQAAHTPISSFKRQLVLLTDGQTSEPDLTMKMARDHALACRVSILGVGSTAARHYLRMLAKAGGGVAEFVPEKQNSVELGGDAHNETILTVQLTDGRLTTVAFGPQVHILHTGVTSSQPFYKFSSGRMERMLQRAQAAALTDVTVEWGREGETLKASFGGASSVDQSPAQVRSTTLIARITTCVQ